MAYVITYTSTWHNHKENLIEFQILRNNGDAVTPEELTTVEFKANYEADGDDVYAPIIRKNIEWTVNLIPSDSVTWETFFDQQHDEWKIKVWCDSQAIFEGFMLPDQGIVPFEDRPYNLTIRAADGLGLLKNVALIQPTGNIFKGKYTLVQYVSACLRQTGIDLPLKIYCDIFAPWMNDRGAGIGNDMFQQTKVDHRTFMKNATEYVSCFEALEIILGQHFRLFMDYDLTGDYLVWNIDRIPQYQYRPGPNYYTIYNFDGSSPTGFRDLENYAIVGKNNLIFKTNTVTKSGKFALKSARTNFKYTVWPELPLNNKFERGGFQGATTENQSTFGIEDWTYGRFISTATPINNLPAVASTTSLAYRRSEYNAFGIELLREIILEGVPSPGGATFYGGLLISSGIPVNQGDQIKISFEHKTDYSATGIGSVAMVVIKTAGGQEYFLTGLANREASPLRWGQTTGNQVVVRYEFVTNRNEYQSINIDPPQIPVDGDLYIGLWGSSLAGNHDFFKSFNVEYIPMVAGGYIPVTGDYYYRAQDANYITTSDEEIYLSDSHPRAIKGNLLRANGVTATTPVWYRYGLAEQRHYKELANIGVFNLGRRRYYRMEGTFTSVKMAPENDATRLQPLSFRKTYKFEDLPGSPEFVLVAPLSIDYKKGWITAVFEEVRRDSDEAIPETLQSLLNRIVQAINTNSWGGPTGTPGYPPQAIIDPNYPNTIRVSMNDADDMEATYTIGAGGNAPFVQTIYNEDIGPGRLIQFEFGADIAIGNSFIFSAYGNDITIPVEEVFGASQDGRSLGDSSFFQYEFK